MSDEQMPEQVDEQFRALMEGLRTTLSGVQVLFAFLLTLPFYTEFDGLSRAERVMYYVAFMSSAVATVLLVAPSVHQRARAHVTTVLRRHESHVMAAVRLTNLGTAAAAIALVASAYLVSTLVYGDWPAAVAGAAIALLGGFTWFYLPLVRWRDDS